jgi:hypothetical protein
MRKLAIGAMAAVVAALSLSTAAEASQWRHRGFHNGWHHGWNGGRHWRGGWHHGWRGGWRHHGWRYGWRGGYWGGPRIVIGGPVYDGYCFVKKVRRHDENGNAYIKRVRVCR